MFVARVEETMDPAGVGKSRVGIAQTSGEELLGGETGGRSGSVEDRGKRGVDKRNGKVGHSPTTVLFIEGVEKAARELSSVFQYGDEHEAAGGR